MFAYDFYLYANALLFRQVDPALWAARGIVNALTVPLVGVAAKRNADWSVTLFVSKRFVFHSVTLLGAGVYLLLMAATGYYLRGYGGSWGSALQAVFLFGALLLLAVLMFSGQVRAHVKFFLNRHFFGYKYDYREEWLRFTRTLTDGDHDERWRENVVRAVAEIVESPAGLLWVRERTGFFVPAATWNLSEPAGARLAAESSFVRFMESREWVIDLSAFDAEPEVYAGVEPPAWLEAIPRAWLVVPLMHQERLVGFVVLARSRASFAFNWEDGELLKTVGRQAGGYLALLAATQALADARQFEAFNRLSAYVVHDLKNLVAQLSLVVSNAKRHMGNPEFVRDAIHTVENAVAKMNRLLEQLRKDRRAVSPVQQVALAAVLGEVVQARVSRRPVPTLVIDEHELTVQTERERLAAVMEHLIQNAQEATPEDGTVAVRLRRDGARALIEVQDSGVGMAPEFVRSRLFRPFDTTKGNAGMGIGAYESREFVREQGGEIEVDSQPGRGTTFRIRLPLAPARAEMEDPREQGTKR
jgi:putative PEP-CTERM system histidine kinase